MHRSPFLLSLKLTSPTPLLILMDVVRDMAVDVDDDMLDSQGAQINLLQIDQVHVHQSYVSFAIDPITKLPNASIALITPTTTTIPLHH